MKSYDVVVIGSGTGGQTAAYELNGRGLSVAVVDHSQQPGGTCALYGCQPKKWFYEASAIVARSRHLTGNGLRSSAQGDWASVVSQKNAFTSKIPGSTRKGFQRAGIDFLEGTAAFVDADRIRVNGADEITFRCCVIATGSKPTALPVEGAEHIVTSRDFFEMEQIPERIVFIGGGFISFELAHFAVRLGPEKTRATILEMADRPLAPFDAEMVDLLLDASAAEGVAVQTRVDIRSIEKTETGYMIDAGISGRFAADLVVHGAGRDPDIEDLALEIAGVDRLEKGISVDNRMQTSAAGIYAVGDCAATPQLARVADCEAMTAAGNILADINGGEGPTIDYEASPVILFTYPQYGMVGMTEGDLVEAGVTFRKSASKQLRWPTYKRIGMAHAGFKVLADSDGRILGAHVISDHATGLINTFRMAMINGLTVETLRRQNIMTPYPSVESDIIYMLKPLID